VTEKMTEHYSHVDLTAALRAAIRSSRSTQHGGRRHSCELKPLATIICR
jgi:hypothetical protein